MAETSDFDDDAEKEFEFTPTPATASIADPVRLNDCPIGLFLNSHGMLCLKTEYGDNQGRIDAYIVASGEMFWGSAPQTIASQRSEMVRPVIVALPSPPDPA